MLAQGHKNLQKESLLKSDLADYNYVRNEKDLQAGAADYAGMNRVQSFAPGYANTTPALVLPAYPTGK